MYIFTTTTITAKTQIRKKTTFKYYVAIYLSSAGSEKEAQNRKWI